MPVRDHHLKPRHFAVVRLPFSKIQGGALKRIVEFDGLRAVAVSLVVVYHATLLSLPVGGFIGVDIFFVLSGYLITTLLVSEHRVAGTASLARFYGRRILRIVPALWAMVGVVSVWSILSGAAVQWDAAAAAALLYIDIPRAASGSGDWLVGHGWSVAIEEKFYLVWPLVLVTTLKYRPSAAKWIALLLVIASLMTDILLLLQNAPHYRLYNGCDVRSSQLFIGCLLALLTIPKRLDGLLSQFVWVPLAVLVVLTATARWYTTPLIPGWYQFVAILTAWVLIAIRHGSAINRLLRVPAVVYIGRISYGLYIWHVPIVVALYQQGFIGPVWTVAAITASIITAAISFALIENHAIRFSNRCFSVERIPAFVG
jgi:peptidoglycan/LPS O-acetylase OafA/YrhL